MGRYGIRDEHRTRRNSVHVKVIMLVISCIDLLFRECNCHTLHIVSYRRQKWSQLRPTCANGIVKQSPTQPTLKERGDEV